MMNTQARRLGMRDTRFTSASGLDDGGRSTAADLLVLTQLVLDDGALARIVGTRFADIPGPDGTPRRIQNRNVLLWLYPGAFGVKTGYTVGARFCLVAAAVRDDLRLVAIVLGAPTPESQFSDSATLLNYGFEAFERRTFVEEDEPLGSLQLPGGAVSGATAGGLAALVPVVATDRVERRFAPADGVAFPPAPGEEIGELEVTAGGLDLGAVPVVAAAIPPPPPAEQGPWWRRTLSAVGEAVGGLVHALLG
jgi:D-alanyl-D-alanine carboxypeptidase (penicillin-binding protein 5/6)